MTFSDPDLADDENGCVLGEVAPGSQIVHQSAIGFGQAIEVELVERLVGSEAGATQSCGELLAVTSCNLILDEQGQELGVGEFGVDGLAVARLEGIEDAGQAQLLQVRGEFRNRVHDISSVDLTIIREKSGQRPVLENIGAISAASHR